MTQYEHVLSNGISMPAMAAGTNWMKYRELTRILIAAFESGIRAIDTARDYGNESVVGRAIRTALRYTGLSREDIFITTKIGNAQQAGRRIDRELIVSLKNLRTDYVDLWLMHWPYPDYYCDTWHRMSECYKRGG